MAKKSFDNVKNPAEQFITTEKTPISTDATITPKTQKKKDRLNLYIDSDLLADIKKIAGIEGKSVNSLICEALSIHAEKKSAAIKIYDDYHKNEN